MDYFPVLKQSLKTASYDACIALMFYFDNKNLNIPAYFDFYNKDSILSWMAAGNNINFWTAHAKGEARRRRIPHSGSVQVCALTFSGYLSPLRVALLLTISNMPWTTHACW